MDPEPARQQVVRRVRIYHVTCDFHFLITNLVFQFTLSKGLQPFALKQKMVVFVVANLFVGIPRYHNIFFSIMLKTDLESIWIRSFSIDLYSRYSIKADDACCS